MMNFAIIRPFFAFIFAFFLSSPLALALDKLIDVSSVHPEIVVDIRYATKDNFTKETLYPCNRCLLRKPVAEQLKSVQEALQAQGLSLKVWDCYRPLSIQKKLWDLVPDERYVADPKKGSRHNRGASVDCTLVDQTGQELIMPTLYDDFSPKAHRDYEDLSQQQLKNRALLEKVMTEHGFVGLDTEWWHFDAANWKDFELLDDPLSSTFEWPKISQQAIVVITPSWDSTTGTLLRYERGKRRWKKVEAPWPITVGTNGLAWGRGLHPENMEGVMKLEGDGKAPAGVFTLGMGHGYKSQETLLMRWPYESSSLFTRCIDDSNSIHYNRVVHLGKVTADWASSEFMRRDDKLYEWIIVINHNTAQVKPKGGSCIFLHVWREPGAPTAGCTSMESSHMKELLQWLDPAKHPLVVQLTEELYKKFRKEWQLPW